MARPPNSDDSPSFSRPASAARREMIKRRALSKDLNGGLGGLHAGSWGNGGAIKVLSVGQGRPGRHRMATIGTQSRGKYSAALAIGLRIKNALDPMHPSNRVAKVEALADMSPEKRAEMERLYGRGATK